MAPGPGLLAMGHAAQSNNHVVLAKVIVMVMMIVQGTYFVELTIAYGSTLLIMASMMIAASRPLLSKITMAYLCLMLPAPPNSYLFS